MHDLYDDWLPVEECAQRLDLSPARVIELAQSGVLRSRYDRGYLLVQPALVRGYTTSTGVR